MSYTTNLPVAAGKAPFPAQIAGPPVGFTLINRADAGGTILVACGPNGPQVPLPPGGSLVWADPAVYPYLSLPSGATAAETLVVTDQVQNYANPEAVAAATAVQIAAQGIPSTFLDQNYGTYRVSAGSTSVGITVGMSASLVLSVNWPQAPKGKNVLSAAWDDPAAPDLAPIVEYFAVDNTRGGSSYAWRLPVLAPRLTLTNVATPDHNNGDAYVAIVGNNRAVDRRRQLGESTGDHTVWLSQAWAAGVAGVLNGYQGAPNLTYFDGPVSITVLSASGAGSLTATWVDTFGNPVGMGFPPVAAGTTLVPVWGHPSTPVSWSFTPTAGFSGNVFAFITNSGA